MCYDEKKSRERNLGHGNQLQNVCIWRITLFPYTPLFRSKPGELLKEKQIMQDYGIGRLPMREIMVRLQQENLIEKIGRAHV